jgi:predicted methyltransferase
MRLARQAARTLALCVFGAALGTVAQAQDEQATRMKTALASPGRPQADKDRDAARKPIESVQFLGIKTGQSVIDVFAFGGWFTEVLSAAVGPTGKVYGQNPDFLTSRAEFVTAEKARDDRLGNVTPVHADLAAGSVKNADAAITALNLHDVYNMGGEAGAVAFAKGVFDSLKPGGVFGVIDHAGIAGQDNKAFHRIQIENAREVLTKAGFKIEAESKILANPADDHTKAVRDPSVVGHTDQFIIRARKPG